MNNDRQALIEVEFEFNGPPTVDVADITRLLVDIESIYALAASSAGLNPLDVVDAPLRVIKDNHVVDNFIDLNSPPPDLSSPDDQGLELEVATRAFDPLMWGQLHRRDAPRTNLFFSELRFGSPFTVLVEIPWETYAVCGSAMIAGIGLVFGAPFRAGAKVHNARSDYWESRLKADTSREQYFEWRRRSNANRLKLARIEVQEDPPDADRAT